jgi:hypothetical protein
VAPGKPDPLQAFRLIDAELAATAHREQLMALRTRLAGEMIGVPELVEATLAADFTLVTHTQGAPRSSAVTRSSRRPAARAVLARAVP